MEGDNNTKYCHAKANGRIRKNRIVSLNQEDGVIEGQENLKKYITDFYKSLFGDAGRTSVLLDPRGVVKISNEDGETLINIFTMEEFKNAVFSMEKNKSAGPDGFNAEFY